MHKILSLLLALTFTLPLVAKDDKQDSKRGSKQESRGGGGNRASKQESRGGGGNRASKQESRRESKSSRKEFKKIQDGSSRTPSLSRVQRKDKDGNKWSGGKRGNVTPNDVGQEIRRQAGKWNGRDKKEDYKKVWENRNQNKDWSKKARKNFDKRHSYDKNWNKYGFNHRYHDRPRWGDRDRKWWRRNNWTYLSAWLPYGWSNTTPIYYDSGQNFVQFVNYQPSQDYQYSSAPSSESYNEWLPLGQFLAGRDANQATYSNMFVELAVNKSGEIAGTYYNQSTDTTQQLIGMIDPNSQQAAWKIADKPDSPLMVTAAYNLTQDVANITVIMPDGGQQEWVLVRVDDDES